ncbi:hypothetical protein AMK18_28890 [Streptomyces sp. CB01249]|nr:hypothetical protein AMK18_28890 [Streptomyces sp. CB01249]
MISATSFRLPRPQLAPPGDQLVGARQQMAPVVAPGSAAAAPGVPHPFLTASHPSVAYPLSSEYDPPDMRTSWEDTPWAG